MVILFSRTYTYACYEETSEVHPFKLGSPSSLDNPVIQSSKVTPFSLSILHMIRWNSSNGGMDEGYAWVWLIVQTIWKQNASNREYFKQ